MAFEKGTFMSISAGLLAEAALKFIRSKIFWYLLITFSVFGWYKWNQWTIRDLRKQNAKLHQENQILQLSLEEAHKNYTKIRESLKVTIKEKEKSAKELDSLRRTLFRENMGKKSLEELAESKSNLVEKKINQATSRVLKCLEKTSKGEICED